MMMHGGFGYSIITRVAMHACVNRATCSKRTEVPGPHRSQVLTGPKFTQVLGPRDVFLVVMAPGTPARLKG